jgi:regulator of G-protein signaling
MNTYEIDFFTLLKHKDLCPLFEEWLRDDFSYENYAFWKDVEEYKQVDGEEGMKERAQEIYDRYFQLGSEWEINADHYQKIELRERIKDPTKEIFDDIQISIFVLMRMDSYPKFMESDKFAKYMGHDQADEVDEALDDPEPVEQPRRSGGLCCISA